MAATLLLSGIYSNAQIKNSKTETVYVSGNCGMCKSTIEKAGSRKNTAAVIWNQDSKTAIITYDAIQTNRDEILKRIALAGYDSESFFAPEETYAKLPDCCQYKRSKEGSALKENQSDHSAHANLAEAVPLKEESLNQVEAVYDAYFSLKDAFIQSDAKQVAEKAGSLLTAVKAVKMEKMETGEHHAWMEGYTKIQEHTSAIVSAKNLQSQRNSFSELSKVMTVLMQNVKPSQTVYLQNCPMFDNGKGGNWLSTELAVKNPYYGSSMLSCGSTVKTIK